MGILAIGATIDVLRQWSLTHRVEHTAKLLGGTVIEEAQGTSSGGRIVDDLRHELIILTEVELVPDTDLTSRIYDDIPQLECGIELTQEEDLDLGSSLLLVAVHTGGEDLGIVEDKDIILLEVV